MYSTDTPQYLNTRSLWRTDIRQGAKPVFPALSALSRARDRMLKG
ncbi:hypothetical protein [Xenorhabdus bovienii]|nr:hypothetical protein [Xenorhabdus bovienii]